MVGGRGEKTSLLVAGMLFLSLVNLCFKLGNNAGTFTGVRKTAFLRTGSKLCLYNTKTMIKLYSKDDNNNNNYSCGLLGNNMNVIRCYCRDNESNHNTTLHVNSSLQFIRNLHIHNLI